MKFKKQLRSVVMVGLMMALLPRMAMAESATCPLVDQRGYQELFASVETLERELQALPGCTPNTDLKGLVMAQNQLRTSATSLQGAWQDPTNVDPVALAAQVTSALSSVNTIADSLQNNALLNSACGKDILSSGKVLLALNDVISNLAPLALLAGTMTSTLSATLPYVIGVVGVSSITRILAKMQDGALDMDKYVHRQLVLKNTCEYSKVHSRIRYLQLAQTGQVEALQAELRAKKAEIKKPLEGRPALNAAVNRYEEITERFETVAKMLKSDKANNQELASDLEGLNADAQLQCAYGRELHRQRGGNEQFPFGIASLLLVVSSDAPTVQTAAVINAHNELENSIDALFSKPLDTSRVGGLKKATADCAALTMSWIQSVGRVITVTESYMKARQTKLQKELDQAPEYRAWYLRTADLQRESKLLEKIMEFMKTQSLESSAISRSELHQRIREIRSALFGRNRTMSFGSSPVMSWLDHSIALHRVAVSNFQKGVDELRRKFLNVVYKDPKHNRDLDEPIVMAEELSFMAPSTFPVQSEGWKLACNKLENIWMDWLRAADHLDAAVLFCKEIEPLIADDIEAGIAKACIGEKDLSGKVLTPSRVAATKTLTDRGIKPVAELIQAKRIELRCPSPEMFKE